MPLVYDIEDHALFKRGVEKGIEKNKKSAIINMLKDGTLSLSKIAEYSEVDTVYVAEIQEQLNQR